MQNIKIQNILQYIIDQTTLWAPKVLGVIVIIIVYLVLSRVLRKTVDKLGERLELDAHLTSLLIRTSRIALLILALVSILGTLGINVTALVAGVGLTGFAVGFALKDTISNLLSGVMIMLYQPFKLGDNIKVSGFEGEVVSIDMRYTQLNSHGSKKLIPNAKLFTDPITVLNLKNGIEG